MKTTIALAIALMLGSTGAYAQGAPNSARLSKPSSCTLSSQS